ncbi:MAG: DUF6178 family protein [Bdellovibrionota bacterium]
MTKVKDTLGSEIEKKEKETSLVNEFLLIDPKHLAKAIFNAELPEQVVREIPPLNLYMAIEQNGLISSVDLIDIMTVKQRRIVLDLDCWQNDKFNEANFFSWLSLTDEENSLELLKKIFASSDLKLVSFLLGKYLTVHYQTEPTDLPPAGDFYTPDKGYTWIKVETNNIDYDFLLKRLLALIFDISRELFYQIISVQTVCTPSELEETAYKEKSDRLASEGIPTFEEAIEINRPITKSKILEKIKKIKKPPREPLINITPLSIKDDMDEPLKSFIANIKDIHTALSELSRILNASIVFYERSFNNIENIYALSEKIKGILNIGLEKLLEDSEIKERIDTIYPIVNLQDIYKYGLNFVRDLRNKALKILKEKEDSLSLIELEIVKSLSEAIPALPSFVKNENEFIKETSYSQVRGSGNRSDNRNDNESNNENNNKSNYENIERLITGKKALRNYNDIIISNRLLEKINS